MFERDRWGLSSLRSERFHYVAKEVRGHCLDMGCGRGNAFVRGFLGGNGKGIDIFPYEGLSHEDIVDDMTRLPFADGTFDTITFIACLNHVPESVRDAELSEAFRCLRLGGNIVITMGNAWAEIAVHKLVHLYDKLLRTRIDVDSERGMSPEESYYLTDREISERLRRAGFQSIRRKYFISQWGLNHLFVAWKHTNTEGAGARDPAPVQKNTPPE